MGESPRKGSFAPPGLLAVRVCSHGSRHGLLSRAPPGLMPMKVTSKMQKLQVRAKLGSLSSAPALPRSGALRLFYPYGPMSCLHARMRGQEPVLRLDRKSTRLNSSHANISY